MRKRIWILISAVVLAVACRAAAPDAMRPSEFQCDNCRMAIVDMKFKAEVLSPKGKLTHFDSIECMNVWSKKNPDQVGAQWVTSYYTSQWLPLPQARVMYGEKVQSPMGGHLVAVATDEEWQRAVAEFGGLKVPLEDLPKYGPHH